MAITWKWKNKIGELDIKQGERKFTMSVYTGNAMIIFLYENENTWQMYSFFADKTHFKNCAKDPEYNYCEEWRELRLWEKPTTDQWLLIKDLVKRGVEVRFIAKPAKDGSENE